MVWCGVVCRASCSRSPRGSDAAATPDHVTGSGYAPPLPPPPPALEKGKERGRGKRGKGGEEGEEREVAPAAGQLTAATLLLLVVYKSSYAVINACYVFGGLITLLKIVD